MKQLISTVKLTLFLTLFALVTAQNAFSQAIPKKATLDIDEAIQSAFDSLKARKWKEAIFDLDRASKIADKEKKASEYLFTLFTLPDEDSSYQPSSETERQIMGYRHAMATKQALLQFLAFTHQLNGNSAEAEKYQTAVYNLQSPFWGLSWRVFMPRFYKVFNDLVKDEKGENFGRYQYLAANLLLDSGSKMTEVFDILQTARQNSPKDADIAGLFANALLQKGNPQEARRSAEFSLSVKPDQLRVLIDLATAEWLLGDFDNSIKHATAAAKIDADMPGPHLTLAMNYIEKKDYPSALKEAAVAVELTNRHPFYLTVQAAAFEASGNQKEAEKLILEAWKEGLPTAEDLDVWYVNETLRKLILQISNRLSTAKTKK